MESLYLTDLTSSQIEELVIGLGAPAYRTKQLLRWIYHRLAFSFDEMSDLSKNFRQTLTERVILHKLSPIHKATSLDGTIKTLFTLPDGKTVESTLMPNLTTRDKPHYTVCLSTQVGCPIGCPFCATGQQGFERNLTPGEIIDQVLFFARHLLDKQPQDNINNLVFMGMGEPLANYANLWQAIEILNARECFSLGARNMTISTAGLVPQIKQLSKEKLQLGLAISLHASTDKLRDWLVPLNKKYPLQQLILACREYVSKTGRRITFEYTLFDRVNDSPAQARRLAHLIYGLNCHVNLIAANKTNSGDLLPSTQEVLLAFEKELKRLHIQCTIRQSRGLDIYAGCGQLRSRHAPSASAPR